MGKIAIEIKKPQYMLGKTAANPDQSGSEEKRAGLPMFFKVLLWAAYGLCGFALWQVARLFLKM